MSALEHWSEVCADLFDLVVPDSAVEDLSQNSELALARELLVV